MAQTESPSVVSSGVEALIDRLREEGAAEGRQLAEEIARQAEERARRIVAEARAEADALRHQAQQDAERFQRSASEALEVAARDALLSLKRTLTERFTGQVRRLVADEMKQSEMLRQLILEVAGRLREPAEGAEKLEVLLPREVIGLEELRRSPKELNEGALTGFVQGLARELVREGVRFGVADDDAGGLRIHLVDEGIELDMTDEAVAAVLLRHLQPRFRALLEGIVR